CSRDVSAPRIDIDSSLRVRACELADSGSRYDPNSLSLISSLHTNHVMPLVQLSKAMVSATDALRDASRTAFPFARGGSTWSYLLPWSQRSWTSNWSNSLEQIVIGRVIAVGAPLSGLNHGAISRASDAANLQ